MKYPAPQPACVVPDPQAPTRAQVRTVLGAATKGSRLAKSVKRDTAAYLVEALAPQPAVVRWLTRELELGFHPGGSDPARFVLETRVNSYLAAWAHNATWTPRSRALHELAAQRFHVESLVFSAADDVAAYSDAQMRRTLREDRVFLGAFVTAVAARTAEQLAGAGLDTITVFRGEAVARAPRPGVHSMTHRPLSSWSLSLAEARKFAKPGWVHYGAHPVVYAMTLPASRVWSTALTGPGCLAEHEVIVLGGVPDTVLVLRP